MKLYESRLPLGFWNKIPKVVYSIKENVSNFKAGVTKVIDTELIYSSAMILRITRHMMEYELAETPQLIFDENSGIRIAKTKSVLKNALKVESSYRVVSIGGNKDHCIRIDGCAIM
jgi:hypothetical protein